MLKTPVTIVPVPIPVKNLADHFGRTVETLNEWCEKGWLPGAYRHESGMWMVNPVEAFEALGLMALAKKPKTAHNYAHENRKRRESQDVRRSTVEGKGKEGGPGLLRSGEGEEKGGRGRPKKPRGLPTL